MPFQSLAQMRGAFSGAFGSEMKSKAKEWAKETPNIKNLPEHKGRIGEKTKHTILKRAVRKKISGKGGPSPFSQADKPIDLLKSGDVPPTASSIPKSINNSLGK